MGVQSSINLIFHNQMRIFFLFYVLSNISQLTVLFVQTNHIKYFQSNIYLENYPKYFLVTIYCLSGRITSGMDKWVSVYYFLRELPQVSPVSVYYLYIRISQVTLYCFSRRITSIISHVMVNYLNNFPRVFLEL